MTAAIVALLALVCLLGGWLPGFAALAAALWLFTVGAGLTLSPLQYLILSVLLVMVPAAAYLAGVLLDSFAWRTLHGSGFAGMSLGFAAAAALSSGLLPRFVEAAFAATSGVLQPAVLLGAALNATLLCGAVTALCIMLVQLIIEVPFRWLQGMTRASVVMPFAALRPLLVTVVLTLLVHHIAGMYAAELTPQRVLQAAEKL